MVAPSSSDEEVQIRIAFELEEALQEMKQAINSVDTFSEKVSIVIAKAEQLGAKYKVAAYNVAQSFKDANKAFDTGLDTGILNKAANETKKIGDATAGALQPVKLFGDGLEQSGEAAEKSTLKFNVFRTVLGTLTALAIFQVIQLLLAFVQALSAATDNADKLTRAIIDLKNIEGILSRQGVDVSMKDLFDIVSKLEEKFKLLSQVDLTNLVANASIATREFGFTADQIQKTSEIAAALAETQKISADAALEAVIRSLSGRSQGNQVLKQAGIFLTEEAIKQRAVNLGLAENTKNVSQAATAQAVLSLELEKTAGLMSEVGDLEDSNSGKTAALGKKYQDLLTDVGQGIFPFVANVATGLTSLIVLLDQFTNRLKVAIITFQSLLYAGRESMKDLLGGKGLDDARNKQYFEASFSNNIKDQFKTPLGKDSGISGEMLDTINKYITAGDTATSTTKNLNDALGASPEELDKIKDKLKQLAEDLVKLGERSQELKSKFNTELGRDAEDFATKNLRQLEDYNRNVLELSQETNNKLADKQRKYREQEQNDERKFQERMLELREKFLFDLEDALHQRDAKQVLRLIKSYNLEKEQEIRKHNLDQQDRAQQNADELADIKKQAADKFAQLSYEYHLRKQREQQDYDEREQRRLEDYQKEQADLQKQIDDKLQQLSHALADELGLNADGATAIYKLLQQFYGPNQLFDGLFSYSYDSLVAKTEAFIKKLQDIAAQAQQQVQDTINQTPSTNPKSAPKGYSKPTRGTSTNPKNNQKAMADGGALVANSPTSVLFGEQGAEAALFIPLNKLAAVVGQGSAQGSSGGSQNQSAISLEVTLSKDLEARIVKQSMDNVANVVANVRRNKN